MSKTELKPSQKLVALIKEALIDGDRKKFVKEAIRLKDAKIIVSPEIQSALKEVLEKKKGDIVGAYIAIFGRDKNFLEAYQKRSDIFKGFAETASYSREVAALSDLISKSNQELYGLDQVVKSPTPVAQKSPSLESGLDVSKDVSSQAVVAIEEKAKPDLVGELVVKISDRILHNKTVSELSFVKIMPLKEGKDGNERIKKLLIKAVSEGSSFGGERGEEPIESSRAGVNNPNKRYDVVEAYLEARKKDTSYKIEDDVCYQDVLKVVVGQYREAASKDATSGTEFLLHSACFVDRVKKCKDLYQNVSDIYDKELAEAKAIGERRRQKREVEEGEKAKAWNLALDLEKKRGAAPVDGHRDFMSEIKAPEGGPEDPESEYYSDDFESESDDEGVVRAAALANQERRERTEKRGLASERERRAFDKALSKMNGASDKDNKSHLGSLTSTGEERKSIIPQPIKGDSRRATYAANAQDQEANPNIMAAQETRKPVISESAKKLLQGIKDREARKTAAASAAKAEQESQRVLASETRSELIKGLPSFKKRTPEEERAQDAARERAAIAAFAAGGSRASGGAIRREVPLAARLETRVAAPNSATDYGLQGPRGSVSAKYLPGSNKMRSSAEYDSGQGSSRGSSAEDLSAAAVDSGAKNNSRRISFDAGEKQTPERLKSSRGPKNPGNGIVSRGTVRRLTSTSLGGGLQGNETPRAQ